MYILVILVFLFTNPTTWRSMFVHVALPPFLLPKQCCLVELSMMMEVF